MSENIREAPCNPTTEGKGRMNGLIDLSLKGPHFLSHKGFGKPILGVWKKEEHSNSLNSSLFLLTLEEYL